ncbi:hypothetical protein NFB65_03365 [Yersinia ruckeri]|nr:hypothetical protein [Yersinia ruckeri]MCW6567302.1 hypothetical protein [Yersinia ruckeri]
MTITVVIIKLAETGSSISAKGVFSMSRFILVKTAFFGDLKKSDALYKYEIYSDQMETVFQTTIYAEQTITQGKHSYSVWVRKDHRILKAAPHAIDQAIDACEEHWEKTYGNLK